MCSNITTLSYSLNKNSEKKRSKIRLPPYRRKQHTTVAMISKNSFFLAVCLLIALTSHGSVAMNDKATGIPFAPSLKELNLFGVGVRKKGPIKVYSVGMYCSEAVRESLSTISRTADKGKQALSGLMTGAREHDTSFVLKMNMKVGAEKMASAIAESVAPRHNSAGEVDSLKSLIFAGVSQKGAAVKGTVLQFDCSPESGVDVSVDGKEQGNVASPGLAKAFCDVYLDDKCVSPALKDSILQNCCAP